MRRAVAVIALAAHAIALLLVVSPPASAALREVTIGNYYFEDDATRARDPLTVQQGDQIRFTVREGIYPPHSVQVDELGISSPDLVVGDTFTTEPLERPGSYRLYCRAHEDRNHVTRLVVQGRTTTTTSTTTAAPTSTVPAATGPSPGESTSTTGGGGASTVPGETETTLVGFAPPAPIQTVPSGVGWAADVRKVPPEPGSLAAVLGRRPTDPGPWTRSLRLAAVMAVVILDTAIAAVLLGRRHIGLVSSR